MPVWTGPTWPTTPPRLSILTPETESIASRRRFRLRRPDQTEADMLYKNNIAGRRISADARKRQDFSLRHGQWWLDYSRLRMDSGQRDELFGLVETHSLAEAVRRLFEGAIVNPSENQAALHMALRAADPARFPQADPERTLAAHRDRFLALAGEMHLGERKLTDLVHLGIGGSDLGP
ncbi:MAG: hypothetical protein V2J10_04310, partial [Wenzhouxiangella sp.]|nr:hypothetical protein [Wenzhouxiangella sp.]